MHSFYCKICNQVICSSFPDILLDHIKIHLDVVNIDHWTKLIELVFKDAVEHNQEVISSQEDMPLVEQD